MLVERSVNSGADSKPEQGDCFQHARGIVLRCNEQTEILSIFWRYYFQGDSGFASRKRNRLARRLPMVLVPTQLNRGLPGILRGRLDTILRARAHFDVVADPGSGWFVEPPVLRIFTDPVDLEIWIPNEISLGAV